MIPLCLLRVVIPSANSSLKASHAEIQLFLAIKLSIAMELEDILYVLHYRMFFLADTKNRTRALTQILLLSKESRAACFGNSHTSKCGICRKERPIGCESI